MTNELTSSPSLGGGAGGSASGAVDDTCSAGMAKGVEWSVSGLLAPNAGAGMANGVAWAAGGPVNAAGLPTKRVEQANLNEK